MVFNIDNPLNMVERIHGAIHEDVGGRLRSLRDEGATIRYHVSITTRFVKANNPHEVTDPNPSFENRERFTLLPGHTLADQLEAVEHNLLKQIDNYEQVNKLTNDISLSRN